MAGVFACSAGSSEILVSSGPMFPLLCEFCDLVCVFVVCEAVLGWAFIESGRAGVCNICQAGLWDVEGAGLLPVPDPALARALRDKVRHLYPPPPLLSRPLHHASVPLPGLRSTAHLCVARHPSMP